LVIIPEEVNKELQHGKDFPEIGIITNLIKNGKIGVKKIKGSQLIEKLSQYNIFGGEAEVIALCWQEKADIIATDDDNVRKKKVVLDLNVIGTPVIILKLYLEKIINEQKFEQSINELRKIGWFSNAVLDSILMEARK
jgi:predicted nucleic acid-binding protein